MEFTSELPAFSVVTCLPCIIIAIIWEQICMIITKGAYISVQPDTHGSSSGASHSWRQHGSSDVQQQAIGSGEWIVMY